VSLSLVSVCCIFLLFSPSGLLFLVGKGWVGLEGKEGRLGPGGSGEALLGFFFGFTCINMSG
jgi:hypothetical protein